MFEVGKKYTAKNSHEFECIVVTETHAWLNNGGAATAYVWTLDGKAVSLGGAYDIKPAPREFWLYRDIGDQWQVKETKPFCRWDEVIHVREVLE